MGHEHVFKVGKYRRVKVTLYKGKFKWPKQEYVYYALRLRFGWEVWGRTIWLTGRWLQREDAFEKFLSDREGHVRERLVRWLNVRFPDKFAIRPRPTAPDRPAEFWPRREWE